MKHFMYSILLLITKSPVTDTSKFVSYQRMSGAKYTQELGECRTVFENQCILLCMSVPGCLTVSYNQRDQQCLLGSSEFETGNVMPNPDWDIFRYTANTDGSHCQGDSCFVLVNTSMTWSDAQIHCQSQYSGHLAHFKTRTPMEFVISNVLNNILGNYWVGASDLVTEGERLWLDGTKVSDGFTYWRTLQPDNSGNQEDCLTLSETNFEWNDLACTSLCFSICQYAK